MKLFFFIGLCSLVLTACQQQKTPGPALETDIQVEQTQGENRENRAQPTQEKTVETDTTLQAPPLKKTTDVESLQKDLESTTISNESFE